MEVLEGLKVVVLPAFTYANNFVEPYGINI
jgi:hypothetical protein